LAQISNDPVRIGPLVERDVGDAEILVRGPMSALGYEFAIRDDARSARRSVLRPRVF
jgi:hypothetical protein